MEERIQNTANAQALKASANGVSVNAQMPDLVAYNIYTYIVCEFSIY